MTPSSKLNTPIKKHALGAFSNTTGIMGPQVHQKHKTGSLKLIDFLKIEQKTIGATVKDNEYK